MGSLDLTNISQPTQISAKVSQKWWTLCVKTNRLCCMHLKYKWSVTH